jgi:hypothetical protein
MYIPITSTKCIWRFDLYYHKYHILVYRHNRQIPSSRLDSKIIRFFDASVVVASLKDEHKSPFHAMFNQNNIYFPHALYKI